MGSSLRTTDWGPQAPLDRPDRKATSFFTNPRNNDQRQESCHQTNCFGVLKVIIRESKASRFGLAGPRTLSRAVSSQRLHDGPSPQRWGELEGSARRCGRSPVVIEREHWRSPPREIQRADTEAGVSSALRVAYPPKQSSFSPETAKLLAELDKLDQQ